MRAALSGKVDNLRTRSVGLVFAVLAAFLFLLLGGFNVFGSSLRIFVILAVTLIGASSLYSLKLKVRER